MTNTPHPPIQKSLKERWQDYLAMTTLDLRGLLIEAVCVHQGWEEGAIALVDEAIMPVLTDEGRTPEPSPTDGVEAAAKALHEKYREARSVKQVPWEQLLPIAREAAMDDARLMIEAYEGRRHAATPDPLQMRQIAAWAKEAARCADLIHYALTGEDAK